MDDTEIVEKLEEFSEFLSLGTVVSDMIRWIGWVFIKGLAFIVDGLESVTDDILLIKQFFQNPEIATFVDTIRPFLFLLLAFSIAYAGYLLIFQKKLDREGMVINLLIALVIITSLSSGMNTANEFTDDAISAVNNTQLYEEGEGSLADSIISKQLTDIVEFDKNDWETTDIDPKNTLPLSMISQISITEKFSSKREELELSSAGQDIAENKITWVSEKELVELEDSTLMPWRNENYYRYSVNWLTLIATLGVMAFTLFSIAYKLARLSFELTFNYVLAIIIAPADVADGQKTKKIIQSILNTFLVIILIFLSMKVYMIGTAYIANELNGLAYVIALIGFSVAVIDGPNIVERLFGIDAGLKNGWGLLAGAYAGGKLVSGVSNSASGMLSKFGNSGDNKEDGENKKGLQSKQGLSTGKAISPNEESDNSNAAVAGLNGAQGSLNKGTVDGKNEQKGINAEKDKDNSIKLEKAPSPNDMDKTSGQGIPLTTGSSINENGAPSASEEGSSGNSTQGIVSNGNRVPSPNDQLGSNSSAQGISSTGSRVPSPNDTKDSSLQGSVSDSTGIPVNGSSSSIQSSGSLSNSVPSPNDADNGNTSSQGTFNGSGSQNSQSVRGIQQSTMRTDSEIENVTEQATGSTTIRNGSSGNSPIPSPNADMNSASTPNGGQSHSQTTSGSGERQQNSTTLNRTGGNNQVDENITINESQGSSVQGSRNVTSTNTGGGSTASNASYDTSGASSRSSQGSSHTINQNNASNTNTQNETVVNQERNQRTNQNENTRINEMPRLRSYNLNQNEENSSERMKNFRRNR